MLLHKIVAGRGERTSHVARSSQKHRLNPGGADTLDVSSGYHKVRGRGSLIVRENARAIVGKNVDVRVKDLGQANRVYVTDTASIDGVDLDDPRIVTVPEGL